MTCGGSKLRKLWSNQKADQKVAETWFCLGMCDFSDAAGFFWDLFSFFS